MKLNYEELTYNLVLIILIDRCAMYKNELKKEQFQVWHIVGIQNTIMEWITFKNNIL